MQLAREFTTASFPVLGRAFQRHHSTIVSAVSRAHNLMDLYPAYFDKREAVIKKLGLSHG